MSKQSSSSSERRSFLTRLQAGAASLAALALGGRAMAQVKTAPATRFEPTRHEKDDWIDAMPGKHRMVIDTTTADGIKDGLLFASNFFVANRNDYGLQNQDIAVIVVARHRSTGYAFNEAMWTKYGASLSSEGLKEPPKTNPVAPQFATLAGQGVQFAVCGMATRRLAGQIATATGQTADAVVAELSANLAANARLVAAGIIAVNRAQERGFSLASA